MSIQLKNNRINLLGLNGIPDHLKALVIANKTIDALNEQLEKYDGTDSDWFRRVTDAHSAWSKTRRRITDRLSILRSEEKELNKLRSRYEDEELLKLLRKQADKTDLKVLVALARSLADERVNADFNNLGVT